MFRRLNYQTFSRQYTNVVRELQNRELISAFTDSSIFDHLQQSRVVYLGFDPTGESLHLGHLLPIMVILHMAVHGHKPILLLGGATASIGDPSGRDQERALLDTNLIHGNSSRLHQQLKSLFSKLSQEAKFDLSQINIVNNADWYASMNVMNFFREIGSFARVSSMLHKDIVKKRLESQHGINYAEFSYQLFQSYDFYHLYQTHGCTVQIGGHDQWGNITAGIEYVKKKVKNESVDVFGLTMPLLTTKNGIKFGKSMGNPIWLDETKTSAYQMYQYLLSLSDESMNQYLKMFTLRKESEIEEIVHEHLKFPENRLAQKILATDLTKLVHGHEKGAMATEVTRVLFDGSCLGPEEIDIQSLPRILLTKRTFLSMTLVNALVYCNLVTSKTEGRRLIESGGIYLNGQRIRDVDFKMSEEHLNQDNICVLRKGRVHYIVLYVQ